MPAQSAAERAYLLPPVACALPQPVAVVAGPARRVVAANEAWRRFAGEPGIASLDDLFPRGVAAAEAALASGVASLSLRALPARRASDDASTWWDIDLVPHPEAPGALVVTARDVTAEVLVRREGEGAREALESVAARLRLAQEATGVGTWEWDAEADRLSWSPEQFRLHGLDPARDAPPAFADWIAMVHPEDRPAFLAAVEGRSGTADGFQAEFRLRRADTGEERWLLSRGRVAQRRADGRPARLLGVNLDVTERRREAEALAEREERLRLAFAAARLFAWDWDLATGRVAWSEGAEAICGLPPGAFGGTADAFRDLVHPEDRAIVEAALGRALGGEDPEYAVEFRMRRGDGTWRWTSTRGVVIRAADGTPVRVVGVDHDASFRLKAEEAERARAAVERETRLRVALTAGGMGAWDWDLATGAVRWDALMGEVTGLPWQDPDAEAFFARIHPEDRPSMDRAVAAALEAGTGGLLEAEFRFRRGDGAWRWLGARGQVVAGPDGRPARMVGVNWDLTDVREAAAALARSEARLRLAKRAGGIGIYDYDVDADRIFWDETARAIWGVAEDEPVTYAVFAAGVYPDDLPAVEAAIARAFDRAGDGVYAVEYRVTSRRDGVTRVAAASGLATFRDGHAVRLVGTVRDVTAERAAAATEARLAAVVASSSDAIVSFDAADGRILSWNAGAEALFGHTAAEALGGPVGLLVPPDLPDGDATGIYRRALAGERVHEHETERLARDGTRIPVAVTAARMAAADGRPIGVSAIFRDLRPRLAAEERLRERNRQLDLLARTSQRLLLDVGPDRALLEAVFGDIASLLGADSYFHYRPVAPRLLCLELAAGVTEEDRRRFATVQFGELLCGRVAEARMRLVVEDLQRSSQPGAEILRESGATSYAGFPLLAEDRLIGTIAFVSCRRTHFRDGELQAVQTACDQIAVAVERRRLQRALGEGEARFRAIVQDQAELVCRFRGDGTILFANRAYAEAFGTSAEALEGRSFLALVPEAERAGIRAALAALTPERPTGTREHRVLGPDGAERWMEWTNRLIAPADASGAGIYQATGRDVTARKAAEAALAESEALLRLFVERAPAGVAMFDTAMRYLAVSRRFLTDHGMPPGTDPAALAGRRHDDVFPEVPERWREIHRRVLAGETVAAEDDVLPRPDGRTERVRWEMTPWRHADGSIGGAMLFSEVVTARIEAERALRESEAFARRIGEVAPSILYVYDLVAGRNIWGNREMTATLGYGPEALAGLSGRLVEALIHPDDRPGYAAHARRITALADGETAEFEYRFRRADGDWVWLHSRDMVFRRDAAGRPVQIIGAALDVTVRRRAEAGLAESEARFRALVEAIPQIAFSALPDGSNDFMNSRWEAYSGQAPGQGLGRGWEEAIHPEDLRRTTAAWSAALASGAPYEIEHRLRRVDGAHRWFLTRAVPVRGAHGTILRWFGTSTDISDIVAAREAAARSAAELERLVAERTHALTEAARGLQAEMRQREQIQAALLQAQKLEALGQLTSGVAHDFNNLLAAIQGSYRLLRREVAEAGGRVAEVIRHGEHAAERGARLIAQLTAFARREEPRPALVLPADLLEGVRELFCHTAGPAPRCTFDADPAAWPILVDPVRLETVLLNLASNARDAMPGGGEIRVSARNAVPAEAPPHLPAGREFVRIAVADTGAGMDAETLRRAAEPFFTTKPRGAGTGLGLASAQTFCAASDGALRILSAPAEGTTVEIFLPRASVLPSAAGGTPAEGEARHGGAAVLLVDDDDSLRPVTAALLRGLGYAVVEAPSAEAALALVHATEGEIDMLVTDIVMRGSPGTDLAGRLRAARPGLPVLYLTGHVQATALDGAEGMLRKPFAEADLAHAVLRGLGRMSAVEGRTPPPQADQLRKRLHPAPLRRAYDLWLAARRLAAGALPSPGLLERDGLPAEVADHAFLAEILPAPDGAETGAVGFRFVRTGRALEERFGAPLPGEVVGAEAADQVGLTDALGGSLGAAYRRCARTRAPHYDHARFDLGNASGPVLLERLVLPLSADGVRVTHVLGVSTVTGQGRPG